MLRNYFEEIPLTEDIRFIDYGMGCPTDTQLYRRTDGMTYDYHLYTQYQEFVKPKVHFDVEESSTQPIPDLLNEVGLMSEVGCNPENPPDWRTIVPAIQEKLNTATTPEEFDKMAETYGDWLYYLYGIRARFHK